jgi:hypothetical protein
MDSPDKILASLYVMLLEHVYNAGLKADVTEGG